MKPQHNKLMIEPQLIIIRPQILNHGYYITPHKTAMVFRIYSVFFLKQLYSYMVNSDFHPTSLKTWGRCPNRGKVPPAAGIPVLLSASSTSRLVNLKELRQYTSYVSWWNTCVLYHISAYIMQVLCKASFESDI